MERVFEELHNLRGPRLAAIGLTAFDEDLFGEAREFQRNAKVAAEFCRKAQILAGQIHREMML